MKGFIKWFFTVLGFGMLILVLGVIFPFLWFMLPVLPFVIIFYPVMKLTMPEYMKRKGF